MTLRSHRPPSFFPYITTGFGFHALKKLSELGLVSVNERTLLISSRLMMTLVSFIGDACIFSIATILGLDTVACLIVFASSFATLVFLTRTMTHAISAGTFALMLLLVVDSRRSQLAPKEKQEKSKKTKLEKRKQDEVENNHGFWLGVFWLGGTVNHPGFFIYALIPMIFWLTGSSSQFGAGAARTILKNTASLLPGVITMGTFLLVLDSTYYGTLNPDILLNPNLFLENLNADLLNNLTIAPLNFLHYNFFDAPVELRPKSTHLLFNLPLLFFPLVISFIKEVFMVYSGRAAEDAVTFTSSTSRAFFVMCFTTPLLVFSILPIQDPKLLLPLIFPLVLLYADAVTFPRTRMPNPPWIVWNMMFGLLFGAVIQAGVVPALGEIKSTVTAPVKDNPIMYHYVFYHTSTPPQHLLALPPQSEIILSGNKSHLFQIHDLGHSDRMVLHQTIDSIIQDDHSPTGKQFRKEVFVFAPASVDVLFCRINVKFVYKFVKKFTPHLSLESPPFLFPDYTCSSEKERSYSRLELRERIPALFSLNMYRVEIVKHVNTDGMGASKQTHKEKKKKGNSFNQ